MVGSVGSYGYDNADDTFVDCLEKSLARFVIKAMALAVLVITFIAIMRLDYLSNRLGVEIAVSLGWIVFALVAFDHAEYIREKSSFKIQSFWGLCLGVCIGFWFVPESFWASLFLFFVTAFVLIWETDKPLQLCDFDVITTTWVTMILSMTLANSLTVGFVCALLPGLVFATILVSIIAVILYCVL